MRTNLFEELEKKLDGIKKSMLDRHTKWKHEEAAGFMEREKLIYEYALQTGDEQMLSECLDRMAVICTW